MIIYCNKTDYVWKKSINLLILILSFSCFHHADHNPVAPMPVASPGKGGALDGRGADTAVCKKNKTTETNHERLQHEIIPARTAPG